MRQPTGDECGVNAPIVLDDGRIGYAIWYPQMGGFCARAIAVCGEPGDCVDVYVWHDGDFPFDDKMDLTFGNPTRPPRELHFCEPGDFIEFGERLLKLQSLGGHDE